MMTMMMRERVVRSRSLFQNPKDEISLSLFCVVYSKKDARKTLKESERTHKKKTRSKIA